MIQNSFGDGCNNQKKLKRLCLRHWKRSESWRWSNQGFAWFGCGGKNQTSQLDELVSIGIISGQILNATSFVAIMKLDELKETGEMSWRMGV